MHRRGVVLAFAVLAGGCLILPRTNHRTETAYRHGPTVAGPVGRIVLEVAARPGAVAVVARRARPCWHDVFADEQVTSRRRASLVVPLDDGDGLMLSALFGVVTLPVSAVVTAIVIAGDDPVTTRRTRRVRTDERACPMASPDVEVVVVLPSGRRQTAVTDAAGAATVAIPPDEPPGGTLIVSAGDAAPVSVTAPRGAR